MNNISNEDSMQDEVSNATQSENFMHEEELEEIESKTLKKILEEVQKEYIGLDFAEIKKNFSEMLSKIYDEIIQLADTPNSVNKLKQTVMKYLSLIIEIFSSFANRMSLKSSNTFIILNREFKCLSKELKLLNNTQLNSTENLVEGIKQNNYLIQSQEKKLYCCKCKTPANNIFDETIINLLNSLSTQIKQQVKTSSSFVENTKEYFECYKESFNSSLTLFADLHETISSLNINNLVKKSNVSSVTSVVTNASKNLDKVVKEKTQKFNEIIEKCLTLKSNIANTFHSFGSYNHSFFEEAKSIFKKIKECYQANYEKYKERERSKSPFELKHFNKCSSSNMSPSRLNYPTYQNTKSKSVNKVEYRQHKHDHSEPNFKIKNAQNTQNNQSIEDIRQDYRRLKISNAKLEKEFEALKKQVDAKRNNNESNNNTKTRNKSVGVTLGNNLAVFSKSKDDERHKENDLVPTKDNSHSKDKDKDKKQQPSSKGFSRILKLDVVEPNNETKLKYFTKNHSKEKIKGEMISSDEEGEGGKDNFEYKRFHKKLGGKKAEITTSPSEKNSIFKGLKKNKILTNLSTSLYKASTHQNSTSEIVKKNEYSTTYGSKVVETAENEKINDTNFTFNTNERKRLGKDSSNVENEGENDRISKENRPLKKEIALERKERDMKLNSSNIVMNTDLVSKLNEELSLLRTNYDKIRHDLQKTINEKSSISYLYEEQKKKEQSYNEVQMKSSVLIESLKKEIEGFKANEQKFEKIRDDQSINHLNKLNEISNLSNNLQKKTTEFEKLKLEKKELDSAINNKDEIIKKLNKEIESNYLRMKITEEKNEREKQVQEEMNKELLKILETRDAEISSLNTEIRENILSIKKIKEENEKLNELLEQERQKQLESIVSSKNDEELNRQHCISISFDASAYRNAKLNEKKETQIKLETFKCKIDNAECEQRMIKKEYNEKITLLNGNMDKVMKEHQKIIREYDVKLESCNERIASLNNEKLKIENNFESMKVECDKLKYTVSNLTNDLKEKEMLFSDLLEENKNLIEFSNNKEGEYCKEIEKIKQESRKKDDSLLKAQNELNVLKEQIINERKNFERRWDKLNLDIKTIEAEIVEIVKISLKNDDETKNLKYEINIDYFDKVLSSFSSLLTKIEEKETLSNTKLKNLQRENEEAKSSFQKTVNSLNIEVQKHKSSIVNLEQEIQLKINESNTLSKFNEDLNSKISELEEQLKQYKVKCNKLEENITEKINKEPSEKEVVKTYEMQLKSISETLKEKEKIIRDMQIKYQLLEGRLSVISSSDSDKKSQIEALSSENTKNLEQVAELTDEKKQLQRELKDAKSRVEEYIRRIDKLEKDKTTISFDKVSNAFTRLSMTTTNNFLLNSVKVQEKKLFSGSDDEILMQQADENDRNRSRNLLEDYERLKMKYDELDDQFTTLKNENSILKINALSLEESLTEENQRRSHLEKELKDKETKLEQFKKDKAKIDSFVNLNAEYKNLLNQFQKILSLLKISMESLRSLVKSVIIFEQDQAKMESINETLSEYLNLDGNLDISSTFKKNSDVLFDYCKALLLERVSNETDSKIDAGKEDKQTTNLIKSTFDVLKNIEKSISEKFNVEINNENISSNDFDLEECLRYHFVIVTGIIDNFYNLTIDMSNKSKIIEEYIEFKDRFISYMLFLKEDVTKITNKDISDEVVRENPFNFLGFSIQEIKQFIESKGSLDRSQPDIQTVLLELLLQNTTTKLYLCSTAADAESKELKYSIYTEQEMGEKVKVVNKNSSSQFIDVENCLKSSKEVENYKSFVETLKKLKAEDELKLDEDESFIKSVYSYLKKISRSLETFEQTHNHGDSTFVIQQQTELNDNLSIDQVKSGIISELDLCSHLITESSKLKEEGKQQTVTASAYIPNAVSKRSKAEQLETSAIDEMTLIKKNYEDCAEIIISSIEKHAPFLKPEEDTIEENSSINAPDLLKKFINVLEKEIQKNSDLADQYKRYMLEFQEKLDLVKMNEGSVYEKEMSFFKEDGGHFRFDRYKIVSEAFYKEYKWYLMAEKESEKQNYSNLTWVEANRLDESHYDFDPNCISERNTENFKQKYYESAQVVKELKEKLADIGDIENDYVAKPKYDKLLKQYNEELENKKKRALINDLSTDNKKKLGTNEVIHADLSEVNNDDSITLINNRLVENVKKLEEQEKNLILQMNHLREELRETRNQRDSLAKKSSLQDSNTSVNEQYKATLRQAFVKLLDKINWDDSVKSYVSVILRMLDYTGEQIEEISGSKSSKKKSFLNKIFK